MPGPLRGAPGLFLAIASTMTYKSKTHTRPRGGCGLLFYLANDAAWVPCGKHSVWNIPSHHASGPDHRPRSDPHTGQNDCSAAHPHVRSNCYRLTELLLTAQLGIEWVHRGID